MPSMTALAVNEPSSTTISVDPLSVSTNKGMGAQMIGSTARTVKPVNPGPPRIDLEPVYTKLRARIGDHWNLYKESIGKFVLGELNQAELTFRISHLINNPESEFQHNSLVTSVYGNVFREGTEAGLVAPWVTSNDKPTSGPGVLPGLTKGGDKVEERLRREVMGLPYKDRKRLKDVGEVYDSPLYSHDPSNVTLVLTRLQTKHIGIENVAPHGACQIRDYRTARSIRLPDTVPASAGGLSKTNWDIEIRRRYAQPLCYENGEFPDEAAIANRMLPICYEEALPGGPADLCAEVVAAATEAFMKDVLSSFLGLIRSNAYTTSDKGIVESEYEQQEQYREKKKQCLSDQPSQNRPLNSKDLKFALGMSSCRIGSMADIMFDIATTWPDGVLEGWSLPSDHSSFRPAAGLKALDHNFTHEVDFPGSNMTNEDVAMTDSVPIKETDIIMSENIDNMSRDIASTYWQGSGADARARLFDVLDECLSVSA